MPRSLYICIALLFCFTNVQAQPKTMNGYLRDSITHFPISGGTITNATTGKETKTNEKGFFRLPAAPNDRIYIVANAYNFDTLTYSPLFADTVTIYLSPTGTVLPGVTVTTQYNKYQLDSIERRNAYEEARGQRLSTVASTPPSGFGLGINLDRFFKKKYRQQKQQEYAFQKSEEAAYVHYRFSPELVASQTGLKGEELRIFLQHYTPSYTWLRQHPSDEAVLYYLNEKLKEFRTKSNRS